MTPVPRSATPPVPMGKFVGVAVVCSLITTAVFQAAVNWAEPKPTAAKSTLVTNLSALNSKLKTENARKDSSKSPANSLATAGEGTDATVAAPDEAADQPASAYANDALDLIAMVRDNSTGYFGGSRHAALSNDLFVVERAANALSQYTGPDPGKSVAALATSLNQAITRLDNIASRDTEDADSVQVSLMLKAKLEEIRDGLPRKN